MKKVSFWRWSALALCASLAACSALPDKPVRSTLYDFGPSPTTDATTQAPTLPALVMHDVEAAGTLDGSSILYRLAYADERQLKPYSQARWSAPPPQLVRQRLGQLLGQDRAILDPGDSAALARSGGAVPRIMRIDLEEFSHLFESQTQSWGLVRLRATLMENTAAGEKLLAQRTFAIREPAPTPDAAGGVRALTAATDTAARQLAQWLQTVR